MYHMVGKTDDSFFFSRQGLHVVCIMILIINIVH